MKKILLIIITILLIPITVNAEEEWFTETVYDNIKCDQANSDNVASDIIYESGKYKLKNIFDHSFNFGNWDSNNPATKVYQCDYYSQTECVYAYIILKNSHCEGVNGGLNAKAKIQIEDGATDVQNFYVGKKYKYEHGVYNLEEYEEHPITDITKASYLSDNYEGYYFCRNYSKSCSELYIIRKHTNTISGYKINSIEDVENYILASSSYIRKGNEYILNNPRKIFPTKEGGITLYSCYEKKDRCTTLYKTTIDINYEYRNGRRVIFDKLEINNQTKSIKIKTNEQYNIKEFFSTTELRNVFSTNPKIADIKDNQLVLYRNGETDLIYENDETYKALHITVTKDSIISNPKTNNSLILNILLGILIITTLLVLPTKKRS